jgi:tripartite-type tricarboxylate transporter receptor subunit TctC
MFNKNKMPRFIAWICGAAFMAGASALFAQAYPTKPVSIVVPFAAGGPTDVLARILADRLTRALGRQVLVENTVGASGSIGVGRVAKAPADGYTVGIGHWSTHVVNGAVFPLTYHVMNDFDPVAMICTNPQLVVSKKDVPARNLKELIEWVRANQSKISAGTAGVGSASHIGGLYFQKQTGTNFQFVPYKGAGPAVQDLIGGQIDIMFDQAANSLPHVRAGRIKAYAVTAKERTPAAAEIPTVDEAGLPGLYIAIWHGIWLPKGAPKEIVARLNSAIVESLADETLRLRFAELGQTMPSREQQTPQGLAAYHKAEIDLWWPIIKAANVKVE